MPVFEYSCNSCGKKYDAFVISFSTPDEELECSHCQEKNSTRLLSMKSTIASSVGGSAAGGNAPGCGAASGSPFG
ncbi:MAG: zinc ribbon domain-containing protein [Candidatus Marinimicrobia bacterium]|jgi:putative FmdB family regulatory protein|nr:zinc ribbon domain-containing protein [Candidatus Neomarinimicrobiota bacterium]MBT3633610.1 zinc ribbon domain-containing protein [Candidatus Neomarinimicrobiota bacterium]MBT3682437.1 zinc ribbon domain-containing protein [Candidatus Neomarinimicrobiota bacterium]MBT3759201.1 zinc ribbon domain-containing protein [Candidatus Neomarinimicrobiota bacterium]MBT3895526.1 zinc ribbon domain-containing protein [Candidatus Neomarinimicrobiota bacterium]